MLFGERAIRRDHFRHSIAGLFGASIDASASSGNDESPMVLMTGFGYDPGHSIVKARQAGLHPKGILYKPFRIEQLVSVTETILDANKPTAA